MTHKILHVEMNGTCKACPHLRWYFNSDNFSCGNIATDGRVLGLYSIGQDREVVYPPIPNWCPLPDAQEPEPFNIMEEVYR